MTPEERARLVIDELCLRVGEAEPVFGCKTRRQLLPSGGSEEFCTTHHRPKVCCDEAAASQATNDSINRISYGIEPDPSPDAVSPPV
jgi:hypothetical protein